MVALSKEGLRAQKYGIRRELKHLGYLLGTMVNVSYLVKAPFGYIDEAHMVTYKDEEGKYCLDCSAYIKSCCEDIRNVQGTVPEFSAKIQGMIDKMKPKDNPTVSPYEGLLENRKKMEHKNKNKK